MGNLSNVLVLLFCISTVFVLAGVSMHDINPANNNVFYNCNKTIMAQYGTCTDNNLDLATPNSDATLVTTSLPTIDSSQTSVVNVVIQTISNVFTSIGNWITNSLGLNYLQSAMDTPRMVLNIMGVPAIFVWAIAGLFIALTVFYFIDWMKGAFA